MIQQRDFLKYVIFSIITCGIYSIYYWYKYTEDINTVCESDNSPSPNYIVVILLTIVTCGIYMYFWYYKQADRLYTIAPKYNTVVAEEGTKVLLLMIVFSFVVGIGPWIAMYILTNNLNKIAIEYNNGTRAQ